MDLSKKFPAPKTEGEVAFQNALTVFAKDHIQLTEILSWAQGFHWGNGEPVASAACYHAKEALAVAKAKEENPTHHVFHVSMSDNLTAEQLTAFSKSMNAELIRENQKLRGLTPRKSRGDKGDLAMAALHSLRPFLRSEYAVPGGFSGSSVPQRMVPLEVLEGAVALADGEPIPKGAMKNPAAPMDIEAFLAPLLPPGAKLTGWTVAEGSSCVTFEREGCIHGLELMVKPKTWSEARYTPWRPHPDVKARICPELAPVHEKLQEMVAATMALFNARVELSLVRGFTRGCDVWVRWATHAVRSDKGRTFDRLSFDVAWTPPGSEMPWEKGPAQRYPFFELERAFLGLPQEKQAEYLATDAAWDPDLPDLAGWKHPAAVPAAEGNGAVA